MTRESRSNGIAGGTRRLAAYLNGTHSGLHAVPSRRHVTPRMVVEACHPLHVNDVDRGHPLLLGRDRWLPRDDAERQLRASLARCLGTEESTDLVMFGSIARGSTTGYSDVDAILVVDDDVINDVRRLRALRRRMLAAGRAVLAYQPLQHHGFLVVTPRLLQNASAALGLPVEALETTSSLFGRPVEAVFQRRDVDAPARFRALARSLLAKASWPDHPWHLHRAVATFELAPTLYVQASGRRCAKHESFDLGRREFSDEWHPYDVLDEVRESWPRESQLVLEHAASMLRNPWTAVALWRRLPAAVPDPAAGLLTADCLRGLQQIVRSMTARLEREP